MFNLVPRTAAEADAQLAEAMKQSLDPESAQLQRDIALSSADSFMPVAPMTPQLDSAHLAPAPQHAPTASRMDEDEGLMLEAVMSGAMAFHDLSDELFKMSDAHTPGEGRQSNAVHDLAQTSATLFKDLGSAMQEAHDTYVPAEHERAAYIHAVMHSGVTAMHQLSEDVKNTQASYTPEHDEDADMVYKLALSGIEAFHPILDRVDTTALRPATDLIGNLHRDAQDGFRPPVRLSDIPGHLERSNIVLPREISSPRHRNNVAPATADQADVDLLSAIETSRREHDMPSLTTDEAHQALREARGDTEPLPPPEEMTQAQSLRYSADMQAMIAVASQQAELIKAGSEEQKKLTANC